MFWHRSRDVLKISNEKKACREWICYPSLLLEEYNVIFVWSYTIRSKDSWELGEGENKRRKEKRMRGAGRHKTIGVQKSGKESFLRRGTLLKCSMAASDVQQSESSTMWPCQADWYYGIVNEPRKRCTSTQRSGLAYVAFTLTSYCSLLLTARGHLS